MFSSGFFHVSVSFMTLTQKGKNIFWWVLNNKHEVGSQNLICMFPSCRLCSDISVVQWNTRCINQREEPKSRRPMGFLGNCCSPWILPSPPVPESHLGEVSRAEGAQTLMRRQIPTGIWCTTAAGESTQLRPPPPQAGDDTAESAEEA